MFTSVIAGVDGSPGGEDALALARRLAAPGAPIVAATVVRSGADEPTAAAVAARVATESDLVAVSVKAGSAAAGLHALASQRGADLLVVGSCRRGAFGRVLAGDDARETVRDAPCPVAVTPLGYAGDPRPIRRIAVGYDEGPEAAWALDVARALGERLGVIPEVLELVPFPLVAAGPEAYVAPSFDDDLRAVEERLEPLDGVTVRAVRGAAIPGLIDASAEVDLLVVGSRHHGPLGRIVVGSTAEALAHGSQAPLLVVPGGRAYDRREGPRDGWTTRPPTPVTRASSGSSGSSTSGGR